MYTLDEMMEQIECVEDTGEVKFGRNWRDVRDSLEVEVADNYEQELYEALGIEEVYEQWKIEKVENSVG